MGKISQYNWGAMSIMSSGPPTNKMLSHVWKKNYIRVTKKKKRNPWFQGGRAMKESNWNMWLSHTIVECLEAQLS